MLTRNEKGHWLTNDDGQEEGNCHDRGTSYTNYRRNTDFDIAGTGDVGGSELVLAQCVCRGQLVSIRDYEVVLDGGHSVEVGHAQKAGGFKTRNATGIICGVSRPVGEVQVQEIIVAYMFRIEAGHARAYVV